MLKFISFLAAEYRFKFERAYPWLISLADYAFAQELFFLIKAPSSSSLDVADLSSSPIELKVQRTSESARGFHRQAVAQSEYGFESFYVPMWLT